MGFMDTAKEAADDLKASFASTEVRDSEQAYRDLEGWLGVKRKAEREGGDVRAALLEYIRGRAGGA